MHEYNFKDHLVDLSTPGLAARKNILPIATICTGLRSHIAAIPVVLGAILFTVI